MTGRPWNFLKSDDLGGRFGRYVLTGGSAAIVDLGGFVILRGMGHDVLVAAGTSFAFAALYNFLVSSTFAFKAEATVSRLVGFLAFAVIGLAINAGVTTVAAFHCPDAMAKVLGIGIAFGVNFLMNNFVVFRNEGS